MGQMEMGRRVTDGQEESFRSNGWIYNQIVSSKYM